MVRVCTPKCVSPACAKPLRRRQGTQVWEAPRAWDISLFGEDYGSAESHRSAEITHWVKPSVLSFLQISG